MDGISGVFKVYLSPSNAHVDGVENQSDLVQGVGGVAAKMLYD